MNKKDFTIIKRAKSLTHAIRGIAVVVKTQPNVWIEIVYTVLIVILGWYYHVALSEWISLIIVCGLVIVSETFNTAVEIDIDLTSPDFHPFARDTKDVAAAAVLISVVIALVVGFLIFVPKIIG